MFPSPFEGGLSQNVRPISLSSDSLTHSRAIPVGARVVARPEAAEEKERRRRVLPIASSFVAVFALESGEKKTSSTDKLSHSSCLLSLSVALARAVLFRHASPNMEHRDHPSGEFCPLSSARGNSMKASERYQLVAAALA